MAGEFGMIEPASAIIQIVVTSLSIIHNTINFIREANLIGQVIENLQDRLERLSRVLELVKRTYLQIHGGDENEYSRFIREALERCEKKLPKIQNTVLKLHAKKKNNLIQRGVLKYKSDPALRDVEEAIGDMKDIVGGEMSLAIALWNLQKLHGVADHPLPYVLAEAGLTVDTTTQEALSPPRLDLSDFESGKELWPDKDIWSYEQGSSSSMSMRNPSISTSASEPSSVFPPLGESVTLRPVGSGTILSPSSPIERTNSVTTPSLSSPIERHDSVTTPLHISLSKNQQKMEIASFLSKIAQCKGTKSNLDEIEAILEQQAQKGLNLASAVESDELKRTALHEAALHSNIRVARILLKHGADINAEDSEPASVLDIALAQKNNNAFVIFLLDNGVDDTKVLKRNHSRLEDIQAMREHEEKKAKTKLKAQKGRKASKANTL